MTPLTPAEGSRRERAVRRPRTPRGRDSALAIAATAVGLASFVPDLPAGLSALLLAVFVAVGPGCAILAWTSRIPLPRLILAPALGLSVTIVVTGAAATAGWWSPHALFAMIALMTLWSVIPNLGSLVRDMVP